MVFVDEMDLIQKKEQVMNSNISLNIANHIDFPD